MFQSLFHAALIWLELFLPLKRFGPKIDLIGYWRKTFHIPAISLVLQHFLFLFCIIDFFFFPHGALWKVFYLFVCVCDKTIYSWFSFKISELLYFKWKLLFFLFCISDCFCIIMRHDFLFVFWVTVLEPAVYVPHCSPTYITDTLGIFLASIILKVYLRIFRTGLWRGKCVHLLFKSGQKRHPSLFVVCLVSLCSSVSG